MLHCQEFTARSISGVVGSCHVQPSKLPLQVLKFQRLTTSLEHSSQHLIILRFRRWVIAAATSNKGATLASDGGDAGDKKNENANQCCPSAVREVEEGSVESKKIVNKRKHGKMKILLADSVTVVMGVGNRVLYKLALIPFKRYPFFLAQFATFGYVLVYFSILYLRFHAGKHY